jgi:hypothetical protein
MKTIQTRYRDVPWSEIAAIHEPTMPKDSLDWELQMRAKALTIQVPALPDNDGCGGPWFRIQDGPTKALWVCPHLAEIGD